MPGSRIYLVGFMGSGKTTTGRKLAARLGWDFIDLDREIEKKVGRSIPDIFSEYGEVYFRKTETEMLRASSINHNTVISSGGGAPCSGDNMDFMISSGITVYLKLTPGQLYSRLEKSGTARPLLDGLDSEGMLKFIKDKLTDREKHYARAGIILEGCDINMEELVSRINSALTRDVENI